MVHSVSTGKYTNREKHKHITLGGNNQEMKKRTIDHWGKVNTNTLYEVTVCCVRIYKEVNAHACT
jgi:hypothetical protein